MLSARSHGSGENRMCIGWPGSGMIQTSRRKVLRPWNGKFDGDVQPLKRASDFEDLSVSLKRYPDTKSDTLIRNLSSSAAYSESRVAAAAGDCRAVLGLDGRGARLSTSCLRTFASVFVIVVCMLRHLLLITLLFAAALSFAKDKSKDRFLQPGPIHVDKAGHKWVDKTLRKMSPEDKVGQLFSIWVRAQFLNDADPIWIQLRDNIHKYHIGSVVMSVPVDGAVLLKSQPHVAAELLNRLQRSSKLPLLVEADFERGVSMRLNGTTVFPHAMAFGATGKTDNAEAFGRITALEARAVGVHWNFFPDADVNSNPANPIINTRSFGEDPQQVGDLVAAYIRGARANGMMTTAKHFPGHGDTATDSHLGVAQVTGDRARLDAVELPPFKHAIEAGVDAVMVAHVTVPALDSEPNRVATTSRAIVTGLLKEDMGFKGIVVTDALDMAGLTRLYAKDIGRAAVESFKAGNDMLIIPADLDASYKAVLEAARSGEIPSAQLDASVLKLLKAKASMGLHKARLVDVNALPDMVGRPENLAIGQQISDDAVTLVRDNGKLLPLKQSGTVQTGLPYQQVEEARNGTVV